ncbi:MAG: ATP-dependent helicase, partial [Rhodoglobus sp.]
RARRRGETASIFLPSVPSLLALATQLELERDHALDRAKADDPLLDDALLKARQREQSTSDVLTEDSAWEAIQSDANFDRVLYDGEEFGFAAPTGSDEELDFIGLPGILEPEQVRDLLRQRQARQSRRATARPAEERPQPLYRDLKEQRKLLNSLVGMRARLSGEPHGLIHAELRRVCGGPAVAQASITQLQSRIDYLRKGLRK